MSDKNEILKLESIVIDQIAAGEVIERPAFLVKELVENSLDAGANEIEIEVGDGGRSVRVSDNGSGIKASQLTFAIDRHTTSKIKSAEDLWKLNSFGFRGEALASMAAVSKLSITSRPANQKMATKVISDFGIVKNLGEIGHAPGTTVKVEELFGNLPARLKFMKSAVAEVSSVKNLVKNFALANPQVNWRLLVNGDLVLNCEKQNAEKVASKDSDAPSAFLNRAKQILGIDDLFECVTEEGLSDYRCHVIFAGPHHVSKTSKNIFFFVQGRIVQDKTLMAAISEAYRGTLMHGEFPSVVVFLNVPQDQIDVNIHPTKSQVKFLDPQSAFRFVKNTLKGGIENTPWKKTGSFSSRGFEKLPEMPSLLDIESLRVTTTRTKDFTNFESIPKESVVSERVVRSETVRAESAVVFKDTDLLEKEEDINKEAKFKNEISPEKYWSAFKVLGQFHLTYILCQKEDSLIFVDQHAAQERVFYERFLNKWKTGKGESQEYLFPYTIEMETEEVEVVVKNSRLLNSIGVEVEHMGPKVLGVKSIPYYLKESSIKGVIQKLADSLLSAGAEFSFEAIVSDIAARAACHSSIRAGQALSTEEMKALLDSMDEVPFSSFCPHGRPVSIELSQKRIEKEFGRTV